MTNDFVKVDKWGECLWGINDDGTLFLNEGMAASLENGESPWGDAKNDFKEVATIGKITLPDGASLAGLFKGCKNLVKADLSGMETDNVTDMSSMFEGCVRLEELDLTSFNTFACKDMSRMFANCARLTSILIGQSFSTTGDGSTDAGKLAIKEESKYRRARVIAAEGFKVRYHSGGSRDEVIEKQTIPNYRYVIEDLMFEAPDASDVFMGWSTKENDPANIIKSGSVLTAVEEDLDFYAIWARAPKIGEIKNVEPFVFGEKIPFELPTIESPNDPEVTGYLEVSPTGEEDSWTAIAHDAILPAAYDGYLMRLHAANSVGEAVSEPVRLSISRANIDMSAVRWAEDADMVYDGTPKHVWVEGLPEGIEPVYTGNMATEAGTYTAGFSFDFDQDNFNEPLVVREHEWTIKKATHDMSDVHWNYEGAFGYTGTEYRVELVGLPHGVTATYENNIAKDAGVYTAIATLHYDNVNFEKPQDIQPCIWEIRKAAIDPAKLVWSSYENFVYDGTGKSVYITNLPDDVLIEYSGDSETLAGKYLARAQVRGNYCTTGPAEYEWEIAKAEHDMTQAHWSDQTKYTYDGETHTMQLHNLPEGLEVRYSGNEGVSAEIGRAHV